MKKVSLVYATCESYDDARFDVIAFKDKASKTQKTFKIVQDSIPLVNALKETSDYYAWAHEEDRVIDLSSIPGLTEKSLAFAVSMVTSLAGCRRLRPKTFELPLHGVQGGDPNFRDMLDVFQKLNLEYLVHLWLDALRDSREFWLEPDAQKAGAAVHQALSGQFVLRMLEDPRDPILLWDDTRLSDSMFQALLNEALTYCVHQEAEHGPASPFRDPGCTLVWPIRMADTLFDVMVRRKTLNHVIARALLIVPKSCAGGAAAARALQWAAAQGTAAVVSLLLEAGAEVDKANEEGVTALMFSAEHGHAAVVSLLLAAGAEVDKADSSGGTPLILAAEKGHAAVVSLLLAAGAEVDKADSAGGTPLMLAAEQGHAAVVSFLLAAGAELGKADSAGWTPLVVAAQEGHVDVVTLLLEAGAEVGKANADGATALIISTEGGHVDVVTLLLEAGAEVDKANAHGATALILAAHYGHAAVVSALLAAGAEVDKSKADGVTALIRAAQNGHASVVSTLLAAGAEVDKAMTDGVTALIRAAQNGHAAVVSTLLTAGASVKNAREAALKHMHNNIVLLIEDHVQKVLELYNRRQKVVAAEERAKRKPEAEAGAEERPLKQQRR
jgi:ankyrin repeat protein